VAGNSPGVCTAAGKLAIEADMVVAKGETNTTYTRSGVNHHISLAHVDTADIAGSPYTEGDALLDELNRLQEQGWVETLVTGEAAPLLDHVHALRDQYSADAVVMITKRTDQFQPKAACGLATQMRVEDPSQAIGAFAVVPVDCATGNFSFAHELGHVMGADHDVDSFPSPHPFAFSHGLTMPHPSGDEAPWRTVMAENTSACAEANSEVGCIRLAYWSNQDMVYGGDKMGTGTADNRNALNATADTVANYRVSCKPTPKPPTGISVQ
jgi:hypothetical protein